MKIFIFIISVLVGTSHQCADLVGVVKCKDILRTKNNFCAALSTNELALCEKTCGVCKSETPVGNNPPAWAFVTPGVKRRNNLGIQKPVEGNNTSDNLALPLYAVIIIIVAVLVIFIGVTVCVIKLKKKYKNRKMMKNIRLLRNATPAVNTNPREYLWGTHNYSDRYPTEMNMDGWGRNMHVPDKNETWQHQHSLPLNNSMAMQQQHYDNGGYNTTLTRAKDKRKAPEPPVGNDESQYQNLQTANATNKVQTSRKPAAQPPPIQSNILLKNENTENVEIPIEYSESLFSEPECVKNNAAEESVNDNDDDDTSSDSSASLSTTKQKTSHRHRDKKNNAESKGSTVDMAKSLSKLSDCGENETALTSILNDWKDHLQEQKKELEDYYKSLANYVQRLGLQAIEQEKHRKGKKKDKRHNDVSEAQYASIPDKYKHMQFPEPPESVMGDQPFEPNNVESQKEVINNLKRRIDKLQFLMQSAKEEKSIPRKQIPDKERHYNNIYFTEERKNTIKNLLQELETKDRLKVQMRIAQALDAANKRGIMTITAKDGPITCLLKQIHHVITDILDPRTGTKIELGSHASFNLANKLLMSAHTNLLPVIQDERVKKLVAKTADRISHLTKQMLDMTKQFNARQMSYQSKDYSIFVNAFVDTNEKIIDTAYQLVSVIRQLQQAEKHTVQSKRSLTMPSSKPSAQSSFHLQQQKLQELLQNHQQRRGVHQQQEGVRHPHPSTLPDRMQSQNNYPEKRLPSVSNSSSLSATDIKRLNHDLARLRQLLTTGCQLEPLSETTASNTGKREFSQNMFSDQFDTSIHGSSDSDTLSGTSCSTCMPDHIDPFLNNAKILGPNFHDEDFPPIKNQNIFSPEPKEPDILAVSHRPPRRPQKSEMISETLSKDEKALDNLDMEQQDEVPIVRKLSTLDPSSFTSFHSDQEQKSVAQPRHQAMLARYFGGEVLHPIANSSGNTNPIVDRNEKTPGQPRELSTLPFPQTPFDIDGTLMLKKPSKKIDLSHIPEITVLRNGTEQPHMEYDTEKAIAEPVTEEDEKTKEKLNLENGIFGGMNEDKIPPKDKEVLVCSSSESSSDSGDSMVIPPDDGPDTIYTAIDDDDDTNDTGTAKAIAEPVTEEDEKTKEKLNLENGIFCGMNDDKIPPKDKEVLVCSSSESSSDSGDSMVIPPDDGPDAIYTAIDDDDNTNDTGTEFGEKKQSWSSCDHDTIEAETNSKKRKEVFYDIKDSEPIENAHSPDILSDELPQKAEMHDSDHESGNNASIAEMLGDTDGDKSAAFNDDSISHTSERSDTPSTTTAVYDEVQKT